MRKIGFDLKKEILNKIKKKGGWVNSHSHLDRAYTLTKDNFHLTHIDFKKKWALNTEIIRKSSVDDIYNRMCKGIETMIAQGVKAIGTFIDVDPNAKDKGIKAAQRVREKYKSDITIKFINQTLHGVIKKDAYNWFKVAAEFVDIIGGLPSKDKGEEERHLDILFSEAKKRNKMLHIHTDQNNSPNEKETEMIIRKVEEYKMQGKVALIHIISLACHPKSYREKIYRALKKNKIMVIANPTAYIDSPRYETLVPFHNAVTPVDELIPHGITVSLGTDNINDLHKPFTNGDMWTELRVLLEATRFFNIDSLVDIATINGRKVLGIA